MDEYSVKIALPEGSQVISEEILGLDLTSKSTETSFSYLDFFGRPTIVFKFKTCLTVPRGENKIRIKYTLPALSFFYGPMYIVCCLFLMSLLYLIISKLDFSFGNLDNHRSDKFAKKSQIKLD